MIIKYLNDTTKDIISLRVQCEVDPLPHLLKVKTSGNIDITSLPIAKILMTNNVYYD